MSIEFDDWVASLNQITSPDGVELLVVVKDGEPKGLKVDGTVIASQWQDASAGPVNVTVEADSPTAPTNWVNVLDFTTPILAAGRFEYNGQVIWTLDDAARQGYFRFGLDGSYSEIIKIPVSNTTDRTCTQYKAVGPLAVAQTHQITIDALLEDLPGPVPTMVVESALATLERKTG